MSEVPITQSTGSISRFLSHIKTAGVPAKVTIAYLRGAGFTSSNDQALLKVFKALNFIDGAGSPTSKWKDYRDDNKSKYVLAGAIRECYASLFDMYSDAYRKDAEAITNWLRGNTELAGITIERAVKTFKALCNEADFSQALEGEEENTPNPQTVFTGSPIDPTPTVLSAPTSNPSININIELHLQASTDPKVYELFFSSMKKHLFSDETK